MAEIDNPMAHQRWIYDNVRQRSSMNWILSCCVRAPHGLRWVAGFLKQKIFLMRDEVPPDRRPVSFHLSAGDHQGLDRHCGCSLISAPSSLCSVLFPLIMLAFFFCFFSHLTPRRRRLRSASVNKEDQKFKTLQPGNNLCAVKWSNAELERLFLPSIHHYRAIKNTKM